MRTLYVREEIQTDLSQRFVNLPGEGPWDEQEDTLPPKVLQVAEAEEFSNSIWKRRY